MKTHPRESLRFGGLTIEYDDRVLRPRPWTELQSRWAAELHQVAPEGPILELCSGAGHIGLLAAALTGRDLVAVDVNPAACYFTELNAEGAGLAHRVEVREGLLEQSIRTGETFALAVADPPWVVSSRVGDHPDDPLLAIDGGQDGLSVARACLAACVGHLHPGGSVLLQLGDDAQAEALIDAVEAGVWEQGGRRQGARGVVQEFVAGPGQRAR
jgi:release factor glutamine methyltransferase